MRVSIIQYLVPVAAFMGLVAQAAPAQRQHLQFTTVFSFLPNQTFLHSMSEETFGNAHLASDVMIEGHLVHADLAARLEYLRGTGPFSGFITLSWPDGDALATRYVGGAEKNADGSTTVTGTLSVIGGTGKYAGASGRGTVLGYRTGKLGADVTYDVSLDIFGGGQPNAASSADGQPSPITGGLLAAGPAKDVAVMRLDLPLAGIPAEQWFLTAENGHLRYGLGRLTGQSQGTSVELLAALEYYDGSGPFSGYVNLTLPDGSRLFCRYSGRAQLNNKGITLIDGRLQVFLGTGPYAGVRGEGTLRATRNGPVASLLITSIELHIQ